MKSLSPPFAVAWQLTRLFLASSLVAQLSAGDGGKEESQELSPFWISGFEDDGYFGTSAILGEGLRTPVSEIGFSVDLVTSQTLEDLEGEGIDRILNVVTQSSAFEYRVRGIGDLRVLRDFVPSEVPFDSYNTERLEYDRGMNSSLWFSGAASGILNQQLKRAELYEDFGRASMRIQKSGQRDYSPRAEIDLNQVLLENRLAVRLIGVDESSEGRSKNYDDSDQRGMLSVRFLPWESAEVRLSHELGTVRHFDQSSFVADGWEQSYRNENHFDLTSLAFTQSLWEENAGVSVSFTDERIQAEAEHSQWLRSDWSEEETFESDSEERSIRRESWRVATFARLDFDERNWLGRHLLQWEHVASRYQTLDSRFESLWEQYENGSLVDEGRSGFEDSYSARIEGNQLALRSAWLDDSLQLNYALKRNDERFQQLDSRRFGALWKLKPSNQEGASFRNWSLFFQSLESEELYQDSDYVFGIETTAPSRTSELGLRFDAFDGKLTLRISRFEAENRYQQHEGLSLLTEAVENYLFAELDDSFARELLVSGSGREEAASLLAFLGGRINWQSAQTAFDPNHRYANLAENLSVVLQTDDSGALTGYEVQGDFAVPERMDLSSEGWELKLDYRPHEAFQAIFSVSKIKTRKNNTTGMQQFLRDFESAFQDGSNDWWEEFETAVDSYAAYYGIGDEIAGSYGIVANVLGNYEVLDGPFKGLELGFIGAWRGEPGRYAFDEAVLEFTNSGASRFVVVDSEFSVGVRLGYKKEIFGGKTLWRGTIYLDNATGYENRLLSQNERVWSVRNTFEF